MSKLLLTLCLVLLLGTSAHAWTLRVACDGPASYVNNIGNSAEAAFNSVWAIIPHAENGGEGLESYLSMSKPMDLVGSLFCVGFSDLPKPAAAVAVVQPCPPCADCTKILLERLKK